MESPNHIQPCSKSNENPSPSSAFTTEIENDMELTLVVSSSENDNDNGRLPDVVVVAKVPDEDEDREANQIQETYLSIAIQVFIPFLIAGFGMVCAGLVLDKIQVNISYYFRSQINSIVSLPQLTLKSFSLEYIRCT